MSASPVAEQLRAGFKWLRFVPELESEFRNVHLLANQRQIRLNLLLGLILIAAFGIMERWLLGGTNEAFPNLLRFGIVVPLILLMLGIAFSPYYTRWYPALIQVAAPVAGICVALIESRAAREGVQLVFGTLIITTVYLYFLVGMLFYAGVRSNLVVLIAYVVIAVIADLPDRQLAYSAMVLALANLVGSVVCYNSETATRTSFLEAKLLAEMAARDGLTGIYNRRMFDERIGQLWSQAVREQAPLAMLLIDIDFFKPFNDRYGHQAGDETLRRVAAELTHFARRPLDFTARYGGEEFAVVLYNADRTAVTDLANRVRLQIESLGIAHERSTVGQALTVSVGAACVRPVAGRSLEGLIQLADEALYGAKHQGRNRVVVMESEYAQLKTGEFRSPKKA